MLFFGKLLNYSINRVLLLPIHIWYIDYAQKRPVRHTGKKSEECMKNVAPGAPRTVINTIYDKSGVLFIAPFIEKVI